MTIEQMETPKVNQRVITKYGYGTIVNFEVITDKIKYTNYFDRLVLCRIGVKLDNPKAWGCHSENSGSPYFMINELEFTE